MLTITLGWQAFALELVGVYVLGVVMGVWIRRSFMRRFKEDRDNWRKLAEELFDTLNEDSGRLTARVTGRWPMLGTDTTSAPKDELP